MPRTDKGSRLGYENRIMMLAMLAALPASACALVLLWSGGYQLRTEWTLTVVIVGAWLGFAAALHERVVFPMQTLANLLGALREGDFSIRGRAPRPDDALGEVMREINTLGVTLREQRLGAMEATTLLRTVMREIDVAIFAFDEHARLRLVNRAGERLLDAPTERLLGQTAAELHLDQCLDGPPQAVLQAAFPGRAGRWGMRRTRVRERGLPLELVVISDLTEALREQELQAWQRLVRVLGHELNNSLTPVKSIAGSLESILARDPLPSDWREDVTRGLGVIHSRSDSLTRFISAYARLAKLPRPQLQPLVAGDCVLRAVSLETRVAVDVTGGPAISIQGDPRPVGTGADQPAAQCRRCGALHRRRRASRLEEGGRHGGDLGGRRWPRPGRHGEPVRALLHHQARRIGHRPGAEPPDRRSSRRGVGARKP